MLHFLKEYFTFSRGERNGIIVLLIIIISLIAAFYLPDMIQVKKDIDFSQFQKEIEAFERQQALAGEKKEQKAAKAHAGFKLFEFDPNEITEDEWRKLGVHEKTVRTIMNYKNKGGSFYEKTDLLKIYGFDSSRYAMIEPYIVFGKREDDSAPDLFDKLVLKKPERAKPSYERFGYEKKPEYKPKEPTLVELNSADSVTLLTVRGIGPAFSKRILKYRELLGGYVHVDQINEVFGMDSARFESIQNSFWIDSALVMKISINSISQHDLEKHPYINRNIARVIVNYREQHGDFRNVDDLKKIYLIDETLFRRIYPYLSVE